MEQHPLVACACNSQTGGIASIADHTFSNHKAVRMGVIMGDSKAGFQDTNHPKAVSVFALGQFCLPGRHSQARRPKECPSNDSLKRQGGVGWYLGLRHSMSWSILTMTASTRLPGLRH